MIIVGVEHLDFAGDEMRAQFEQLLLCVQTLLSNGSSAVLLRHGALGLVLDPEASMVL